MKVQHNTWASHKSVRSFWGLSEVDDADVSCALGQSETVIKEYLEYCTTKRNSDGLTFQQFSQRHRRKQTIGWLCAQRRPGYALGKRGQAYRSDMLQYGTAVLPDYLILVDDDTYMNMEIFNKFMEKKKFFNSNGICWIYMVCRIFFHFSMGRMGDYS